MKTVYFMKGLPGSGKSTESISIIKNDEHVVRVNKDDIRDMLEAKTKNLKKVFTVEKLHNMLFMGVRDNNRTRTFCKDLHDKLVTKFEGKEIDQLYKAMKAKSFGPRERWVVKIQTAFINHFVGEYKNIIVDDTNFNSSHLARIKSLCKDYQFDIIDMHEKYNITIEECLKRNKKRDRVVPEVAIYSMAKKYGVGNLTEHQQSKFNCSKRYVICDIDGTLADVEHRLHFINKEDNSKPDWKAFFDAMSEDGINDHVKSMVNDTYAGQPVVIVTGRPDDYREQTEAWLEKHNIKYDALYMRRSNDRRSDDVVKKEILDTYLDVNMIDMVIDDRKCVLDMWKQNGLNTINVGGENNNF